MDDFRNYLRKPAVGALFSPKEMSELLISVYNYTQAALRDGCDCITVDQHSVKWHGDGHTHESNIGIDLRKHFEQVLQRDNIMAERLLLLEASPDHTTYRIVLS